MSQVRYYNIIIISTAPIYIFPSVRLGFKTLIDIANISHTVVIHQQRRARVSSWTAWSRCAPLGQVLQKWRIAVFPQALSQATLGLVAQNFTHKKENKKIMKPLRAWVNEPRLRTSQVVL